MNATSQVKRISPMLAVEDMDATISFYQAVLGFAPTMQTPEYSIVERDGQSIHFMKAASDEVMKAVRGHTDIYIEVTDIRSLWSHVQTFKYKYRIRDVFERAYGMIELHISDPDGCLVFVGQPKAG